ncbi:hypothetical protein SSX86_023612 [Deinandra increscens subsp. villosa]|uniref:HMA domain-containing protein n=1 Tax=Deinandra increscens subsp. villosa TaxID=3103831 RepID=A0AAP0GSI2_9ASTR
MDSIVLEQPSSSSGTACSGGGGSRAIDRHNPIIRDEKRLGQGFVLPSGSSTTTTTSTTTTDQSRLCNPKPEAGGGDEKRKSVAFANDDEFIQASGFISPASSSRCLLSDRAMSYFSPEFHHVPPPSPPPPPRNENLDFRNEKAFKKKDGDLSSSPPPTPQPPQPPQPPPPPSSLPLTCDGLEPPQSTPHEPSSATDKPLSPPYQPPSSNQVVVLEVALHCRGCERKMKKHISKIEGVTSFKIEFAAKKVTVVGDVTPLAVLTSVLKVKNAKLLTPATISSSSSSRSAQIGSKRS